MKKCMIKEFKFIILIKIKKKFNNLTKFKTKKYNSQKKIIKYFNMRF